VAIFFDFVDIRGMREAHFKQLLFIINEYGRSGCYHGNKAQFEKRHEELKAWVENIVRYAGS